MTDRPDEYGRYLEALRTLDGLPARFADERRKADEEHACLVDAAAKQRASVEATVSGLLQQVDQMLGQARATLERLDRGGLIPRKVRAKGDAAEFATAQRALGDLEKAARALTDHRQAAGERRLAEAKARERALQEEARQRQRDDTRRRAEAQRRVERARKRARIVAASIALLTIVATAAASLVGLAIGLVALFAGTVGTVFSYVLLRPSESIDHTQASLATKESDSV